MKLRGFDFENTLFKFCENIEYCQDIIEGHIYMKENAFFRQLDDTYRGDRFDSRVFVEWEQERVLERGPDGSLEETIIMADREYGLENDNKMPIFCATIFDAAIVSEPQNGYSLFYKEFIKEISKFGKYVVCFPLDEFIEKSLHHSLENGYEWHYSKVHYFDTKAVYSQYQGDGHDMHHSFPFALFKKDDVYRWQNEWRLVFMNDGNTMISKEEDHYIMSIEPFERAKIFEIMDFASSPIL